MIEGIDAASYQGIIDWQAVYGSGRRFAFLKATEGGGYVNPFFHANWTAARNAGLIRGAYCFLDNTDPILQAEFFLRNVGPLSTWDLLALDVEVPQQNEWYHVAAWLGWITYRVGFRPLVYTGQWVETADPGIESIPTIADFGLWKAGTDFDPLSPWAFTAFLQYQTGEAGGRCPGVAGPVDLDRFNGPVDRLRLYGKP